MKKFAAFLLAVILIFSLTACASSQTEKTADLPVQTSTGSDNTPAAETTDTQEEKKPVTVTWVNSYNEDGILKWVDWVKETVENKYPYITLNIETYSVDDVETIVQTKLISDDPPAIYKGRDGTEYIDAGYVYDLSNEAWVSNVQDGIVEGIKEKFGGVLASVPMDTNYYGVFYDKDLFAAHGYEVPETLDEMYALCEQMLADGITPFATGYSAGWVIHNQFQVLYKPFCVTGEAGYTANSNWYTDLESGKTTFTGDKGYEAAAELMYSFKPYFSADPFATDWFTAMSMLATGQAGMIVNGTWTFDGVLSINPDCNISMFPFPCSNDPDDTKLLSMAAVDFMVYNYEDPEMMDATLKVVDVIYSLESGQNYAEWGNKCSTFKEVDVSYNPVFTDMQNYVNAGKCTDTSGVTEFANEANTIHLTRLAEFLMNDTLDVAKFTQSLDADFAAMR